MVREYGCYGEEGYMDLEKGGGWVKYEDYAALHAAASALLREAAKVYKDYNETIAPEFMDMQTLQELADLL